MTIITIGIDAYPADGEEGVHYVFPWEGGEEEARASIEYAKEIGQQVPLESIDCAEERADKRGLKLVNLSRGVLHWLPEILANADDLEPRHKALILSYALALPIVGADGTLRTVMQQLAHPEDILVSITAHHLGANRGEVKGSAHRRDSGEALVKQLPR